MREDKSSPSISDASTPSAGRIYDYLLGGRHNFEIDRSAAKGLMKDVPEMPQWVRLIRWFLGSAIRRLSGEGFTKFLDFASGLPTVDHVHQVAPTGTKVIYSDIDPVTVAYAQEIIKGLPDVAFVAGDAGRPESVLQLDVVQRLFGSDRKVAIGFNGVAWFLPDDRIIHALTFLHEWAAPGSKLFLCDTNSGDETPEQQKVEEFYTQVREPIYPRSEKRLRELWGKWRLCEPGVRPLEEWLPIDKRPIKRATQAMGGNLIGAILEKK